MLARYPGSSRYRKEVYLLFRRANNHGWCEALWEYVIGGATIFGLIVGLFSIYNGRATRKLLVEEERMTRELIAKMDERFAKMDERFGQLLKESSEGHAKILEAIREISSRSKRERGGRYRSNFVLRTEG
ncbi:MAG: hypothetical protein AOA65_0995 [Candidatus Bathyarchaeota archaeon BA1]|nr:MAG: hypothetical protein AOA65_0995 [Candidatus Bathyarchaeota archaeon BA1]